jgi:hypothetical protein
VSSKAHRSRGFRAIATALIAATLSGGGLVALAASASAASDPLPWISTETSSGERAGALEFYNSSDTQIFQGPLDTEPFATYAVADGGPLTGSSDADGATAFLYTPATSDPGLWGNTQNSATAPLGSGVNATYTSLPAVIRSSNREVVPLGLSVNDHTTQYPSSYAAPNNNVYEVRVIGATDQKWYSSDIEIDTANNKWTQIFPAAAEATTTVVSGPTGGEARIPLTYNASVTAESGTPTGTVQFKANGTNFGTAVSVAAATSTGVQFTPPASGQYTITASYTPTDSTFLTSSDATGVVLAATASVPVAPTLGTPTATPTSVTLRWTDASDAGAPITSYTVEYKLHSSATWLTKSSTVAASATSYTITGLVPGTAYDMRVLAKNSIGTSVPSAAKTITTPADASALTISKGSKIAYGKTVKIAGTIKDAATHKAVSGATVSLYAKVSGSSAYKKLKSLKSTSAGALSATGLKPTKTTTYQLRYTGTPAHKAANSATNVVTVARTATVKASVKSIKKGKSAKIYGVVAPVAGGKATIEKKSGKKWVTVGHATIKKEKLPNGKKAIGYVVSYKGTAKGKFTFRVSVASVSGYAAVVTTTVTVTVK